jgi:uncharacterized protein (DUF1800 family)
VEERTKIKRPSEWLVATRRAAGRRRPNIEGTMRQQALMGEPLWRPPAPKGFSDDNAAWYDGLNIRLESANTFAQAVAGDVEPKDVLDVALGPLATEETRLAVARAESKVQALTLLVMAPEFQRR